MPVESLLYATKTANLLELLRVWGRQISDGGEYPGDDFLPASVGLCDCRPLQYGHDRNLAGDVRGLDRESRHFCGQVFIWKIDSF